MPKNNTSFKPVHGMTGTRTHKSWLKMIERCSNSTQNRYYRYGARGITVCERWQTFDNFYADMGARPENRSLDRIDNDKGYSPDNCRWATRKEQARNTSNNVVFGGLCLTEWAELLHVPYKSFFYHYRKHGINAAIIWADKISPGVVQWSARSGD